MYRGLKSTILLRCDMMLTDHYEHLKDRIERVVPQPEALLSYVEFLQSRQDIPLDRLTGFFKVFEHWLDKYQHHANPQRYYAIWTDLIHAALFVYETSTLEKALDTTIVHRVRLGVFRRDDFVGNNRHVNRPQISPHAQFKTIPQRVKEKSVCPT